MTIIDVPKLSELSREKMRAYVCASPMEAATMHKEHYGVMPEQVYQYKHLTGKTTCFIEVGGDST